MKRKLYILSIVLITFFTTSTMLYFHPKSKEMKVVSKYFQMINLVAGLGNEKTDKTSEKVDSIIDDEMLNKFTLFYAGKTIDELEIYEKEEVRYILKTIGLNNIDKLQELLNSQNPKGNEEIYKVLNENLFEEQMMMLDRILKKGI